MILDKIRIENFGAYQGVQEAVVHPEEGKPVVLFGGMNGGGKTTLLDALLLVLYGSRAKVSNRGRLGYREYLKQCINRGVGASEGAGLELSFRRKMEGVTRSFKVSRRWKDGEKGVEEELQVSVDGQLDLIQTEHWDEVIEAYLPAAISNLFFFDGEQIKELAEGKQAAVILGTAIRSLLGLDLVDRLESDLKVFERKKKAATLDSEAVRELEVAEAELVGIMKQKDDLAQESGSVENEIGNLKKVLTRAEAKFRAEGGDLFVRRAEMESNLQEVREEKVSRSAKLRDLAAGALPLALVGDLIQEVEKQAEKEGSAKSSRLIVDAMEERDLDLLEILKDEKLSAAAIGRIEREMRLDRKCRLDNAEEELILDAGPELGPHVSHLRKTVLPDASKLCSDHISEVRRLDEIVSRLELELGRVPEEGRIAAFQKDVDEAREKLLTVEGRRDELKVRYQVLERRKDEVSRRIERFADADQSARLGEDSRVRMLKHSKKVRETLNTFRTKVIQRHVTNMEALMLESFQELLRKKTLVKNLKICPESFEVTLEGADGHLLPFDRLSAGERQLLATAMLWGLARASGRPIPTVIDTPLGRLDSSHRKHLVERYFPCASHQVLLLSTDEEIVGSYHASLKPSLAREYLLAHDEATACTNVQPGYFSSHEYANR